MRRAYKSGLRLRGTVLAMLGAMMVACGGGGGDGPGPVARLDLTVANRDDVSHAVIGGALGIGGADRTGMGSALSVAQRRFAATARTLRAQPMAQYTVTDPCIVSGVVTMTVDDRDENLQLTAGDVVTSTFSQCKNTADEMVNGTMSLQLTSVLSPTDFDARASFTSFVTEQQQAGQIHRYTLNGTLYSAYRQPTNVRETVRLSAAGDFTVGLLTPVFADTVTLRSGFVQDFVDDTDAYPPSGSGGPGRSVVTVTGDLYSAKLDGVVSVKTDAAVVSYAGDLFPREGSLQVNGLKGVMHMTAQPGSMYVQRELDWNDDGAVEDATTVTWDWLV